MSKTFEENLDEKLATLHSLIVSKQQDYGTGNILKTPVEPPELAVLVRLNDKLARAANLLQKGEGSKNESLEDTAMDIMGYGVILWMLIDNTFELPLADEDV